MKNDTATTTEAVTPQEDAVTTPSAEQVQQGEGTQVENSDPSKELQDKLANKGREIKELSQQLEELKKYKEEQELSKLSDQERIQAELDKLKAEKEAATREAQQRAVEAHVAKLAANDSEAPEMKLLIDKVQGTTPEEAEENYNTLKLAFLKAVEERTKTNAGLHIPTRLDKKQLAGTPDAYTQSLQKAKSGDKNAVLDLFAKAPTL